MDEFSRRPNSLVRQVYGVHTEIQHGSYLTQSLLQRSLFSSSLSQLVLFHLQSSLSHNRIHVHGVVLSFTTQWLYYFFHHWNGFWHQPHGELGDNWGLETHKWHKRNSWFYHAARVSNACSRETCDNTSKHVWGLSLPVVYLRIFHSFLLVCINWENRVSW